MKKFKIEDNTDKINIARMIVNEGNYAEVDGMILDLTTASAIVTVYDLINEQNKLYFINLPLDKMVNKAFNALAAWKKK